VAFLEQEIFPAGPPRDGNILRLGLVGSWESQFLGLGRLTAFLTPRLLTQSHAVDDMGLYAVFLQRHRVEVGLKLILERAAADLPAHHLLVKLLGLCRDACDAVRRSAAFGVFESEQREYVKLIDRVDPGAATFRYPVDKHAQPWARADSVDLEALERAGAGFEASVIKLVSALNELEPAPVGADQAQEAIAELNRLVIGCRLFMDWQVESLRQLRHQNERLSKLAGREPRAPQADVYSAVDAVRGVSLALADRADALLGRLISEFGLSPAEVEPPAAIPAAPKLNPFVGPAAIAEQVEKQMKWVVDGLVARARPLTRAVADVEALSRQWSTPAARQLHLDVVRFRSRLVNAMRLEDPPDQ